MYSLPTSLPTAREADLAAAPAINWGVIAPGWIAGQFADAMHRHTGSRVAAVGSTSAEPGRPLRRRTRGGTLVRLLRAVGRPIPASTPSTSPPRTATTIEQALLALSADKPVLVEKAFTQNAAQAAEVIDAARGAGSAADGGDVDAVPAARRRGASTARRRRARRRPDRHGRPRAVLRDRPEHRLLNPDLAGGALLDLGVYPISFTSFVLGAPDVIVASARHGRHRCGRAGVGRAAGRRCARPGFREQAGKTPTTAAISGTGARVEIDGDFYVPQPVRVVSRDGDIRTTAAGPIPGHEGLAYQAAHFAATARRRGNRVPAASARRDADDHADDGRDPAPDRTRVPQRAVTTPPRRSGSSGRGHRGRRRR